MRVVGYVRVSTEDQASSGVSLDAQRERLRAYCAAQGLDLAEVIADEGYSAGTLSRPGLARALKRLEVDDVDGLVVAKLDRLTRCVVDFESLLVHYFGKLGGKRLLSAAEPIETRTAAGRLVIRIQMAVSAWELEANHERTEDALHHKQSRGERTGSVPYGWDLDPTGPVNRQGRPTRLIANGPEQAVIADLRRLKANGWSTRKIAALLNDQKAPTKTGKGEWKHQTVEKILLKNSQGKRDAEVSSSENPPA